MSADAAGFLDILYTHAIEGTYSDPALRRQRQPVRAGPRSSSPGHRCRAGYTAAEVGQSDGLDVIDPTGVVADTARRLLAARTGG